MRTHEVFGIRPEVNEHSYVDRGSLDNQVRKLLERKQSHVAIRGASKSGKSWLRQKVLRDPILVQCRLDYEVGHIYRDALSRLDIRLELSSSSTTRFEGRVTATGEAGFKLLAKVNAGVEIGGGTESTHQTAPVGKDQADLEYVASLIRESGRVLVVEDFHYLPVEQQKRFAFDLKTLWDYRVFCCGCRRLANPESYDHP